MLNIGIAAGVHARTKNDNLARVFVLSETEAKILAEPIADLMGHHVGTRSPEAQRWINLAMAFAGVYGGKLMNGAIAGNGKATPATA